MRSITSDVIRDIADANRNLWYVSFLSLLSWFLPGVQTLGFCVGSEFLNLFFSLQFLSPFLRLSADSSSN